MRWVRRLLIVFAVLIVGGWLTIVFGARSEKARTYVAGAIAEKLGQPVSLGRLRLGWSEVSAAGIKLGDLAEGGYSVEVGSLSGNFGSSGWLLGLDAPQKIRAADLTLTLDLDTLKAKAGTSGKKFDLKDALKKLPKSADLERGTIILKAAGRPDAVFDNVSLKGTVDADGVLAEGTMDSATWKKWDVKVGTRGAAEGQAGYFGMTTAGPVPLTQAMLESLNFIPPSAFAQVRVNGNAEGTVSVTFSEAFKPTADIALKLGGTDLFVAPADLQAENLSGELLIKGDTMTLKNVAGEVVGRPAKADGTISWGGSTTAIRLDLAADGWDLAKLPAKWKIPEACRGKYVAKGTLSADVPSSGDTRWTVSVDGTLNDAVFNGSKFEALGLGVTIKDGEPVYATK